MDPFNPNRPKWARTDPKEPRRTPINSDGPQRTPADPDEPQRTPKDPDRHQMTLTDPNKPKQTPRDPKRRTDIDINCRIYRSSLGSGFITLCFWVGKYLNFANVLTCVREEFVALQILSFTLNACKAHVNWQAFCPHVERQGDIAKYMSGKLRRRDDKGRGSKRNLKEGKVLDS